jgi:hypothetical protein
MATQQKRHPMPVIEQDERQPGHGVRQAETPINTGVFANGAGLDGFRR